MLSDNAHTPLSGRNLGRSRKLVSVVLWLLLMQNVFLFSKTSSLPLLYLTRCICGTVCRLYIVGNVLTGIVLKKVSTRGAVTGFMLGGLAFVDTVHLS